MVTMEISRTEHTTAQDWRITEFVMSTWTEPELGARRPTDPAAALAAFAAAARRPGMPDLRPSSPGGLVIEDLDHAAPMSAPWTFCG